MPSHLSINVHRSMICHSRTLSIYIYIYVCINRRKEVVEMGDAGIKPYKYLSKAFFFHGFTYVKLVVLKDKNLRCMELARVLNHLAFH